MKAVVTWLRHAWIVLLVAGIVVALDQWTKGIVRANVPKYEAIPVLGRWFMWEHVENHGAAFGLLQGGGAIFVSVAILVSIAILIYVRTIPANQVLIRVLLGMQMGGALGNNVFDRVRQGYVTDFIKMGIPDRYYWPNYNIADTGIVCGVIGLAIYVIYEDIVAARRAKSTATAAMSGA